MKRNATFLKSILLVLALIIIKTSFSQTYDENYLDGRIFFKFKNDYFVKLPHQREVDLNNLPDIQKVLSNFSITKVERPNWNFKDKNLVRTFRVIFSDYSQTEEIIKKLEELPSVEYAEKEPLYRISYTPNDPYYADNINGAGNYGWRWFYDLVNAEGGWQVSSDQIGTIGSSNVKIAIVDNAIYTTHEDLDVYLQRDVADSDNDATPPTNSYEWSHGTHCSGLATASTNNSTGIASLGADAQLIAVKCTRNSSSAGYVEYSYDGVSWAINNGADVISMSFGGTSSSTTFQNLMNSAHNDGIVLIAAAGNDGVTTVNYPGGYDHVICVGSVDSDDSRSSFSNYNGSSTWVDIASPGGSNATTNVGLLSTTACDASYDNSSEGAQDITPYGPTGQYHNMSGTSMATPFAAGLCGLMLAVDPTLTPDQIESCLISSGVTINQSIGPRIDAQAAMNCVVSNMSNPPVSNFTANVTTVSVGGTVDFTDLSAPAATSWSWTFNGGTPSSSTTQNPSVTYNTVGDYDVTLTASNSYGTGNTETKTQYIHVVDNATSCDTISHFYGTAAIYGAGAHGYVAGTNDYDDAVKAEKYQTSEVAGFDKITEVFVYFGVATDAGSTDSVALGIWDDNSGMPGTLLATDNVALSDIVADVNAGDATYYNFGSGVTLPSSDFYLGVFLPQGGGDTVAIISNHVGESPYADGTDYEQWNDNTWHLMSEAWNGLDSTSLAIFPIVCPDAQPPVADFQADQTHVCAGTTVNFTDLSSNSPTSWSWTFNGGTPSSSTSQNPSVTYNTAGTYDVTLSVTNGAGSDSKTITTYITVDAAPYGGSVSASPNPICEGNTTTVSVVGQSGSLQWQQSTTGTGGWTDISGATSTSYTTPALSSDMYYRIKATNGVCADEFSNSEHVTVNPNPVAATSVSASQTTICTGSSVDLSYTGGSGTTFTWYTGSCGGTSIGTGNNLSVSPTTTTTYYGRWENSCGNSSCQQVTVNVDQVPTVDAGPAQTITSGTSTTLNGTVSGGTTPYSYLWTPSASISGSNTIEDPTTTNLTATTTYTFSVTAGACSATDQVTITVTGGPLTANPTATPDTICAGSSATITANAGGGSGTYTYSWTSSPAGFTSTNASETVSPTVTTTYTVAVNDGSNTVNESITVIVNPTPTDPTAVSASQTTVCSGDAVTLSYTGGTGTTFNWFTSSCGGTLIGSGNNFTVNPTTNTTYYGRWENSCGVSNCEQVAVTINPAPTAPISVSANPTTVCSGDAVTLSYTGGSGSTFNWFTSSCGGTAVGTGNNITVNPTTNTTYYGRWENSCGASTCEQVQVLINAAPTADFSFVDNGNLTVDFTSLATNATIWNWNFGDGNTSTQTNPSHTYASGGTYNVTLEVDNANGCGPVSTTKVVDVIVSVFDNTNTDFVNVYPNPNNGQFNILINSQEKEDIIINIYNINGQKVLTKQITKTSGEYNYNLNANNLANGVYNLQLIRKEKVNNYSIIIKR